MNRWYNNLTENIRNPKRFLCFGEHWNIPLRHFLRLASMLITSSNLRKSKISYVSETWNIPLRTFCALRLCFNNLTNNTKSKISGVSGEHWNIRFGTCLRLRLCSITSQHYEIKDFCVSENIETSRFGTFCALRLCFNNLTNITKSKISVFRRTLKHPALALSAPCVYVLIKNQEVFLC